jgi:hypothetical protein
VRELIAEREWLTAFVLPAYAPAGTGLGPRRSSVTLTDRGQ